MVIELGGSLQNFSSKDFVSARNFHGLKGEKREKRFVQDRVSEAH